MRNNLTIMRKARGIKIKDLAEGIGVSRQIISGIENGRYKVSIIVALKIARYMNCLVEDIFSLEPDE